MSRSHWKGNYIKTTLLKKKQNKQNFLRNVTISAKYINTAINIHNGQKVKKLTISRELLGYKLGEFAQSRKHTVKNIKNIKKK